MFKRLKTDLKRRAYSARENFLAFNHQELRDVFALKSMPRRVPGSVSFQQKTLRYIDGPSTYYQVRELFYERQYDLELPKNARILDCGSNIGLSLNRFRKNHPDAEITAFEADPEISKVCANNLSSFGDTKTVLKKGAAWVHDGNVSFESTADDAGRIVESGSRINAFDIAKFFASPVDLLKLDIEGGEFEVIAHLQKTNAIDNLRSLVCEVHQRFEDHESIGNLIASLENSGMRCALSQSRCIDKLKPNTISSPFACVENRIRVFLLYSWRSS